ncbi:MAG: threonine-phosphate decarboxylase, partial [Desulfovibrio sp.]|nr:threonine-phosphate decarboxylase [Desulfovibrio sp.]
TAPSGDGAAGLRPALRGPDGAALGYARPDGLVWGGYLHGLFDADAFRRTWLDGLRARRGLPPLHTPVPYDLEPALDRLADVVRRALDMDAVRTLLGV